MAIVSSDIVLRGSVVTGSAGDSTANATNTTWLGKYVATTAVGTGANALFPDLSGAENAAAGSDYVCIFVLNNHATLALLNPVVYLSAEVAGGAGITIATDNIAASAKGSASAQAAQIASRTTTPTGVSAFSAPTTAGTGLSLGATLPAGFVKGVWVKRTAANSAALDADGVTIAIGGDTAA